MYQPSQRIHCVHIHHIQRLNTHFKRFFFELSLGEEKVFFVKVTWIKSHGVGYTLEMGGEFESFVWENLGNDSFIMIGLV